MFFTFFLFLHLARSFPGGLISVPVVAEAGPVIAIISILFVNGPVLERTLVLEVSPSAVVELATIIKAAILVVEGSGFLVVFVLVK